MAVFFYQIGIFLAIQISSLFGKSSRNVALILISIFTILQVYTSGLMILQFVTIFIAYMVSESFINENSEEDITTETKFGRQFGQLPNTSNGVSTKSYGLSASNPILMTSIPSSYRFLQKIIEENEELSYRRIGSVRHDNFPNPIDKYEVSKYGQVVTNIFIYPYYNSNVEIIPEILKK